MVRSQIVSLLPPTLADRPGWAVDIYAALTALRIEPRPDNVCAVLAVTEQESSYRADPSVPRLGQLARQEIDRRAERAGVPRLRVTTALQLRSPDTRTWSERIDFAQRHVKARPYPYRMAGSVRDEVFTRRGGMYFGIAHLLDYPAGYEQMLFRFADFNAGHYASRNAAFQNAASLASGIPLELDGDLLIHGGDPAQPGSTAGGAHARTAPGPERRRHPLGAGSGRQRRAREDPDLHPGVRAGRATGRAAGAAGGGASDQAARPQDQPRLDHRVVRAPGRGPLPELPGEGRTGP